MANGEPTPGLSYNPNSPVYWDKNGLQQELERVFDICHSCRLCFNLCPSFFELFQAVDQHEGEARRLSKSEVDRVIDTCYQCKLCYLKCPYTPDDGHAYQLDFPRLLLRANAVRRSKRGLSLRALVLSHPELVGKIGGLTAPLANWANRQPWMRAILERTLGIHRDKILPTFYAQTFKDWLSRQPQPAGDTGKAVLFATCFVNHYHPQLGKDVIEVFAKNGISLSCPEQNCCGMPAMEAGDLKLAIKLARRNVTSLYPHVVAGKKVLAINPTCSFMIRREYPELVGTREARAVAGATHDLCEYLWELKQRGQFNRDFRSTPGNVAYHLPCHLKAQNIGFRSRDLMRLIPGTSVKLVDHCSGHDGTWAMKKEFFPLSMLAGKKAFEEMEAAQADVLVSDCPLAAVHFDQALGRRPMHPVQVLASAYREDGFPQCVPSNSQK
jgi:Fe-S oxidoreductase